MAYGFGAFYSEQLLFFILSNISTLINIWE
jgi:hypothetical protein